MDFFLMLLTKWVAQIIIFDVDSYVNLILFELNLMFQQRDWFHYLIGNLREIEIKNILSQNLFLVFLFATNGSMDFR